MISGGGKVVVERIGKRGTAKKTSGGCKREREGEGGYEGRETLN